MVQTAVTLTGPQLARCSTCSGLASVKRSEYAQRAPDTVSALGELTISLRGLQSTRKAVRSSASRTSLHPDPGSPGPTSPPWAPLLLYSYACRRDPRAAELTGPGAVLHAPRDVSCVPTAALSGGAVFPAVPAGNARLTLSVVAAVGPDPPRGPCSAPGVLAPSVPHMLLLSLEVSSLRCPCPSGLASATSPSRTPSPVAALTVPSLYWAVSSL